ncbi:class I SAM-dependent methyltransferase [Streptomyces sp. TS71-3]|uniref:class I SAM-dependent methyltransferase n=1 Tax=Streptomyces sp. TS71-3 TaxID=2733862 RepID=UPI001B1D5877|nr:class I SAM-dependent methyltransferase [Streptomyces sp. TS71-3]GHJ36431.1 methyltransferase type 11 [Streptomyces sp. TS71-3]
MTVDFGRTSHDYARYRTAFPPELFARLAGMGVGLPGQRVADLGTGTGVLARDLAAAGCAVTGVDISRALLDQARRQDAAAGLEVDYRLAPAEDTGLPGGAFDVVSAGQCWHWFDRGRAAAEAHRLLAAGGAVVICHRDYLVLPGNVAEASEDLVLAHNPAWRMAGGTGIHAAWTVDVAAAGFRDLETFSFDIEVPFTHEEWRGRMRSCNGVGATLSDAGVAAYDAELARVLAERFPEDPFTVPHRIWALVARRGGGPGRP